MKARYYASLYRDAKDKREAIAEIGSQFCMEHKELCRSRNVKSEHQIISILRELDLKWKAWTKEFPELNPTGFKIIMHAMIPTSKELWP